MTWEEVTEPKNQDAATKSLNEAERPEKVKRGEEAKRPKYSVLSRDVKGKGYII